MNLIALPTHSLSWVTGSITSAQEQDELKNHVPEQRGRIAFASDRDGDFEIYVMDPDGGGQTRLTNNPAEDITPTWSPDGERLAFVSYRDGNPEIYVMESDGGNPTRLTNNPADDLDPTWSPDGRRIAFSSSRDNTGEIYVMNADGSGQTNLSNNREGDDVQPEWSPNGSRLAFASNRDENFEIYVMNADGGNQRNYSNNPATDSNPSWTAMRIAFQSDRDSLPNQPETNFEIYSMSGVDGSGQTRLTINADNPATAINESFDIDPARSTEGTVLAFASTRDGNFEIYVANTDGARPTRLTNNAEANDIQPAIQPLAQTPAQQGTLQFSAANYTVNEGAGSIAITITRTGDSSGIADVDFATGNGTASERSDFVTTRSTIRFAAGETSRTVNVLITDDVFLENDETINLSLADATNAVLGTPRTATLTITDNDLLTLTTNPIDERDFFVRQQYRDFLNRDPDAAGFAFWTGEYDRRVNACNTITDATQRLGCRSTARASISLAFFLSTEFQQTGFLVYRAYDVAFARTGTPRPARGAAVSAVAVTYDEFISDTQSIARGIVVGNTIDQGVLGTNTELFFRTFVQRPEFTARFPVDQSAQNYVNALLASADVVATDAMRAQLLADFGGGGIEARARVLRRIADYDVVFQREFNRAFVLLQYIGYLRRDPDIAGYNFWLNKLDGASTSTPINRADVPNDPEAIGRIRRAEMIEAFIRSCEYQRRFGQPTTSPNNQPVGVACGS
jgi:Tol biopolymer transport system component